VDTKVVLKVGDRVLLNSPPYYPNAIGTIISENNVYGGVCVEWDGGRNSVLGSNWLLKSALVLAEEPVSPINQLCKEAFATATANGFTEMEFPTAIALMHSELSEALEAHRKPMDYMGPAYESLKTSPNFSGDDVTARATKLQREHIAEELADVCLRVFDTCGRLNLDLNEAITKKMKKNKGRGYKHGNKLY
jgi:NTP pyrophosphatase (non-canonical NTP hydrolase)